MKDFFDFIILKNSKQNTFHPSKEKFDDFVKFYQNNIIVTKFTKNGNIEDKIKKYFNSTDKSNNTINPTIRRKLIFGVAAIMKKLHDRNIFNH